MASSLHRSAATRWLPASGKKTKIGKDVKREEDDAKRNWHGPLEDDGKRDDKDGADEEAVGEEGEDEEPRVHDHLGEQHLPCREQLDQHHADGRAPLRLER